MIRLQNLTPEIYYKQSRDFQFIGRLYDLIFNSVKTNADLLKSLPIEDGFSNSLADLTALTLGFKSLHNYNIKQLVALCEVFSEMLRKKGSLEAIEIACNAILGAEGIINASYIAEFDANDQYMLNIFISDSLDDINLLKDILVYILPAGVSCNFIKGKIKNFTNNDVIKTVTGNKQSIHYKNITTAQVGDKEDTLSIIPRIKNIIHNGGTIENFSGSMANETITKIYKTTTSNSNTNDQEKSNGEE